MRIEFRNWNLFQSPHFALEEQIFDQIGRRKTADTEQVLYPVSALKDSARAQKPAKKLARLPIACKLQVR